MEEEELKKEIFEKAHTKEASELCRNYFKKQGLQLDNFYSDSAYYKLSEFIQEEIYLLLSDKTYSIIPRLQMHRKIKFNKDGVCLYVNGSYFDKREAITFNFRTEFIGFCGWASGCNNIPFIKGFVKWCDYIKGLGAEIEKDCFKSKKHCFNSNDCSKCIIWIRENKTPKHQKGK